MLLYAIIFPIIGITILHFKTKKQDLKRISLSTACLTCLSSILLWFFFQNHCSSFQFVVKVLWFPNLNINFIFGIDGISLFFIVLTTLLIVLCLLISWNSVHLQLKEFLFAFLFLDFLLVVTFCVLDLLLFYVFFESILLPMFLVVGIWGTREWKILAAYYFFMYTFLGSVLMLLSILYIYYQVGTTDYEILLTFMFSSIEQKFLWFTFFLAFASKVPMVPMHLWLLEAHVEAPTAASVFLAGVLLKLGSYGFIRFSLPLFPKASFFFAPFIYSISILGIIYASFTAIRQTDFKRVVAYTSIAHMNLVILGIFSFNVIGLEGAVIQSLSHGFVASALFLIIGVVYERFGTRVLQYYGGLATFMPIYVAIFLFFTMVNISFPGSSSFIGEFLILLGSFKVNSTVTFLGSSGIIIGAAYALWLLNRISFGNLKIQYLNKFLDLSFRETLIFFPLILATVFMGVYPTVFLDSLHISINSLVEFLYF